MISRALAFVFVLTVVQLGQGIALRLELQFAPAELTVPVHIGLGALTAFVVFMLARSLRRQKHPVASDTTFLLLLLLLQGLSGLFILAGVEAVTLIHLVLSFIVVSTAAANLILSATAEQKQYLTTS